MLYLVYKKLNKYKKKLHLKYNPSLEEIGRSARHSQQDQTLEISQTFAEEYQQKLHISKDQSEVLGIKKDDKTYLNDYKWTPRISS